MTLIGLLITLLGFIISFLGLGLTTATGVRMTMAIAGILVSLFGIIGLINRSYMKTAIWRR